MKDIIMKPTKNATYLENLRQERDYYKENWEHSRKEVNQEINRLEKLISEYKNKNVSPASMMNATYQVSFLKQIRSILGKKYDNNKNNKI